MKIYNGAYGEHVFIDFSSDFELKIAGKVYYGAFQTGHSFDHNDYNYPTNHVSMYDDDGILQALDCTIGPEDIDFAEFSEAYPDISETEYTRCAVILRTAREIAQDDVDEMLETCE